MFVFLMLIFVAITFKNLPIKRRSISPTKKKTLFASRQILETLETFCIPYRNKNRSSSPRAVESSDFAAAADDAVAAADFLLGRPRKPHRRTYRPEACKKQTKLKRDITFL